MLGAALTAFQIGSQIYVGLKAANERKKLKRQIQAQMDENQDWWERKENEDPTQLVTYRNMLTEVENAARKRNRAAAGTQAVMGGTEESVAAAKAANNQMTSDTASRIAAAGEQRKQALENQYLNRKEALQSQLNGMREQKAQGIAQATQAVGNAVGSIYSALDATAKPFKSNSMVNTDPIIQQNQKATAEWLDGMAKRYGWT